MPPLPGRRWKAAVVDPQTEWSRRKLQALLLVALLVALAVIAGSVWSVTRVLAGDHATGTAAVDPSQSARDRLADEPLPAAPLEAAQPGPLSKGETTTLQVPAPRTVGRAAVATGFPHTAAGALAQLAAIDRAALSSASVQVAQEVIGHWAAPGGPTPQDWSGVAAVAALLESAGAPADGTGSPRVTVEPVMGFIKGAVGEDFAVPCIDFLVTATTAAGRSHRVAVADCQRMVWQEAASGGRWVIGPGEEPAPAPSLWPGSQASFDAGYEWLAVAP